MSESIIETQMHFTMLESPRVVPNLRLSKANRLNKVSFVKGNGVVRKKEIDGFMVFVDWMYIIYEQYHKKEKGKGENITWRLTYLNAQKTQYFY